LENSTGAGFTGACPAAPGLPWPRRPPGKPVHFGKNFRAKPFLRSFRLRCHKLYASAKQDPAPTASRARPANSRPLPLVTVSGGSFGLPGMSSKASPASSEIFLSTRRNGTGFEARSAAETDASPWRPSTTGSTFRPPIRDLASVGRPDAPARPGTRPFPASRQALTSHRFPLRGSFRYGPPSAFRPSRICLHIHVRPTMSAYFSRQRPEVCY